MLLVNHTVIFVFLSLISTQLGGITPHDVSDELALCDVESGNIASAYAFE